jgi:CheY-like chemotaxis protein/transcriptional regulator with XRE-family HTH domain
VARAPSFPASRELFGLVRLAADEQGLAERISDADIGRVVGLESARTSRWKHGRLAIDDAPRLLALAQAFDLDLTVLAHVASGHLSAAEAREILGSERELVRFLGENAVLPADSRTLTIGTRGGPESQVVRRAPGRYDRSFRRGRRPGGAGSDEPDPVVLLADDDPTTLELFGNATGPGTGIRGVVAHNAAEALVASGAHRPRVVIYDVFLPGADGFSALRAIGSDQSLAGTLLVATALHPTVETERLARGCGAIDLLERPLRSRELTRLLRRLR